MHDLISVSPFCRPAWLQANVLDYLRTWNNLEIAETKDEGFSPCPKCIIIIYVMKKSQDLLIQEEPILCQATFLFVMNDNQDSDGSDRVDRL